MNDVNLGLLKMKSDEQFKAATCLPGKALTITIMGVCERMLSRNPKGEAVSHVYGNTWAAGVNPC